VNSEQKQEHGSSHKIHVLPLIRIQTIISKVD